MKKNADAIIYSPSDLIRYLASPFSSWLDRYHLENPELISPDGATEEDQLLMRSGVEHERSILDELSLSNPDLVAVSKDSFETARKNTASALARKAPVIFQAALAHGSFAGYADFLILEPSGKYQVWDTKLARSVKAYYPVQLCCYSEMVAAQTGDAIHESIGVILGTKEKVQLRTEDFVHYYRHLKASFLSLQDGFTGNLSDCPEPLPRADHGHWTSYAERHFLEKDHLVQVAGITTGQIKKLGVQGIITVAQLARIGGAVVPKLDPAVCEKLAAQARLQCQTRETRITDPDAKPAFELLPQHGANSQPIGLATLPPANRGDVYFDMEGYPLAAGGLEYLFGAVTRGGTGELEFHDWWAHDRAEEKLALEGFVDWVYARWRANPALHIYHYAAYEVCAVRRLSTRHDTRQNEVDDLLRNNVFVDLYQVVRQSLRIGEGSYSIKQVERLYRGKRSGVVSSGGESIVQYANWIQARQPRDWRESSLLKGIRDYNEDDCLSTAELTDWLRELATQERINFVPPPAEASDGSAQFKDVSPEARARQELADKLREKSDETSRVLGDLIDFHRREQKPIWWRMFDRAAANSEELRDDPCCIDGVEAESNCVTDKRSLCQKYRFDPTQECKIDSDDSVMFTHNLSATFTVNHIDTVNGEIELKIGKKSLDDKCEGVFPRGGSVLRNEFVSPHGIPDALSQVAAAHLTGALHPPVAALLNRAAPLASLQNPTETVVDAAVRVSESMSGGCLVIQGPPGTGKTFTAARVIAELIARGKRVGIASNSHKAILNLLRASAEAMRRTGRELSGIKVGGEDNDLLFSAAPGMQHVKDSARALHAYTKGVVGGTAWLFTRPEWKDALDFLVIDEAGQVPLANAVAMARSAQNLILLGDQMQLEQPVQGSHPGDAGFSVLQFALKDAAASREDAPAFHAVVPADRGLFLGESRRMHPAVCSFISDSIYERRLGSLPECAFQKIALPNNGGRLVQRESGIVFSEVEHDGNVQRSDEEVERVSAIFRELLGRSYTDKSQETRSLVLSDFLFIAPYNAQVAALRAALPNGARVGSVDKFQGQEAAVCILSFCSSFGEYGSRGLRFILDRARINVAVSRAQCLAIVVGDPRIATSPAASVEEMALLNLYCKLLARAHR
jgi:uncharacterized protein